MQSDKDNIAKYKIMVIFWFLRLKSISIMLTAFVEFGISWNSCYKSDVKHDFVKSSYTIDAYLKKKKKVTDTIFKYWK